MANTEKFETTTSAVHLQDGAAVIAFAVVGEEDRTLEVSMSVDEARLLFAHLMRALNAHQHPAPSP